MRSALPISLLLFSAAACRSAPPISDPRPLVEDPVCRYYGDLGCVDVRVEASTPSASYAGKTYYFCCDECREKFLKEPAKFVPKR